jgi:hypothetical protein
MSSPSWKRDKESDNLEIRNRAVHARNCAVAKCRSQAEAAALVGPSDPQYDYMMFMAMGEDDDRRRRVRRQKRRRSRELGDDMCDEDEDETKDVQGDLRPATSKAMKRPAAAKVLKRPASVSCK